MKQLLVIALIGAFVGTMSACRKKIELPNGEKVVYTGRTPGYEVKMSFTAEGQSFAYEPDITSKKEGVPIQIDHYYPRATFLEGNRIGRIRVDLDLNEYRDGTIILKLRANGEIYDLGEKEFRIQDEYKLITFEHELDLPATFLEENQPPENLNSGGGVNIWIEVWIKLDHKHKVFKHYPVQLSTNGS